MKNKMLIAAILGLISANSSIAQKITSHNRNFNRQTKMVELCENHFIYSNSTYEQRDCMIGKDEGRNFKIDHFETDGIETAEGFLRNDLSERCKVFGYRKAFYKTNHLSGSYEESTAKAFGSTLKYDLNPVYPETILELSNMHCIK